MKFNYFSTLIISLILFISCNDDFGTEIVKEDPQTVNYDEIKVLNGRLYFPNKSTFQNYYNDIRNKDDVEVANVLQNKFYSKDFYSLKPIVNERTEKIEIARHLSKITVRESDNDLQQKTQFSTNDDLLDSFDDLEDIFGEDVFTSFLNQDAEIQISNEVYKYTDAGLFITDVKDVSSLNRYLEEENISKNLLKRTPEEVRLKYMKENNPYGGVASVKNFKYFLPERHDVDEILEPGGGSGGGGSGGGSNTSKGTPNAQLATIANGLEQCSGRKPLLGNLFGTTKVCIDRYEKRRRVKIKYYNIDVLIAYVIGIKTKHQYRGWTRLWRKQNTDEVALGVNSLTWKFPTPTPPSSFFDQPARFYLHDGKMFETVGGYYKSVHTGNVPVPNLPFANKLDIIIEIAIGTPFSNLKNEEDVRKFIYKNLFDTAKGILKTHSNRKLSKMGVVMKTQSDTWVQFYDFSESCTNCAKKENVIDFGIVTPQIKYTFGTGSGGKITIASWDFDFKKPALTGMSAFGMAKRNGQWRGKRMVF